jgi:hypothetical protein
MQLDTFLQEWRLDNSEETLLNHGEIFFWQGSPYARVRCPFCAQDKRLGPDKAHHCHVHEGWFRCQRCGTKGPLRKLLGREPMPTPGKKSVLKRPLIVGPNLFGGPAAKSSPGSTIWMGDLPRTHPSWRYLIEQEKFLKSEVEAILRIFPVHVCTHGKPFTKNPLNTTDGRLIFTITEDGKQIGWQARWLPTAWPASPAELALSKDADRYITSPGLRKSFVLYNFDQCLQWDTIVVVEGIKKVWKTGLFSCATLGIGNSTEAPEGLSSKDHAQFWINRLLHASLEGRKILFLYDKDGISKGLLHADWIQENGGDAEAIALPSGQPKDLDLYLRVEIAEIIRKANGKLPQRRKLP